MTSASGLRVDTIESSGPSPTGWGPLYESRHDYDELIMNPTTTAVGL